MNHTAASGGRVNTPDAGRPAHGSSVASTPPRLPTPEPPNSAASENVIAFLRYDRDRRPLLCAVNFAGRPHEGFRLGLPKAGRWRELLNSDAVEFGGSGVGNLGEVTAEEVAWHGFDNSVSLRVPPLGAVWLRHEP